MSIKLNKSTTYRLVVTIGVVFTAMLVLLFVFTTKTAEQKPFDLTTQLKQDGIAMPQDFETKPVIAYTVSKKTNQRTVLEFDISNPEAQVINIDQNTQTLYLLFPEYDAVKAVTVLDSKASPDTYVISSDELDAFKNQKASSTSVVGGALRYRVYKFDSPVEMDQTLRFTVYGEFELPSVTASSEVLGQYSIELNIE